MAIKILKAINEFLELLIMASMTVPSIMLIVRLAISPACLSNWIGLGMPAIFLTMFSIFIIKKYFKS